MSLEIERRWLVKKLSASLKLGTDYSPRYWAGITQGYLDKNHRVRLMFDPFAFSVYSETAEVTRKIGRGFEREEDTQQISSEAARLLLDVCKYSLTKERYRYGYWELDYFDGPLKGLIILEREFTTREEALACVLPDWVEEAVEVTDTLSNYQLAKLSTNLANDTSRVVLDLDEILSEATNRPRRAVITGAPCSGKSTSLERIRSERSNVMCVPEAATILIAQVGVTPDVGQKTFQTNLRKIQKAFEDGAIAKAKQTGKEMVLFDRGTLDSAAFMGGLEVYEEQLRTTREREFDRYDMVCLMELPSKEVYDENCRNNPARTETYEQSCEVQDRLFNVWKTHPNFVTIADNGGTFDEKYERLLEAIEWERT